LTGTGRETRLRKEYISRINRVIDYIEKNLEQDLTLDQLAGVANFSPWHFHRIFGAIKGESLNSFIRRIRLEKAASQLVVNPDKTVTEIAYSCGFNSSASFARAFKDYFEMSASQWRDEKVKETIFCKTKSKNCKTDRKPGKDRALSNRYIDLKDETWRGKMFKKEDLKIEVKQLPQMNVAYVRYTGPYKGDNELFDRLYTKLCTWAGPRDLFKEHGNQMLSVYHDNPDITDEDKLRVSVCLVVPEDTKVDGDIGTMTVPGGKYAVASFELNPDEFEQAWAAVYGIWLPESGYQPADGVTFELCQNDPKDHPEGKHIVDICVPVKPL